MYRIGLFILVALALSSTVSQAHTYRVSNPPSASLRLHASSENDFVSLYGGQLLWDAGFDRGVRIRYGLELSAIVYRPSERFSDSYNYFAPVLEFSLGNRWEPYINLGIDLVDWAESEGSEYDGHTDVHLEGGIRLNPSKNLSLEMAVRSHNTIYFGYQSFAMASIRFNF